MLFIFIALLAPALAAQDPAGPIPTPAPVPAQTAPATDLTELALADRATKTNALADYRLYLQRFPGGAFAHDIRILVDAREAVIRKLAEHPTGGPRRAARLVSFDRIFDDVEARKAAQAHPGGAVKAAWYIAEDGQIEDCHVLESTASAELNALTCQLIMKNMQATPARDDKGLPFRVIDIETVTWPR
jgi:hypothetical protein